MTGTTGRLHSSSTRIAAAVAAGAIVIVAAIVLLGGGDGGDPIGQPTTTSTTPPESTTTTTVAETTTTTVREPVLYVSPGGSATATGASADDAVDSLATAFALALPGDEIRVLPGTYGEAALTDVGGTPEAPILVTAPEGGVVFDPNSFDLLRGLLLERVNNVAFTGFTVRGGVHGTYIIDSHGLTFSDVDWVDSGQEAVQITEASSNLTFSDCTVTRTGLRPGSTADGTPYSNFGEGFYLGSSSGVDPVDGITIRNCEISGTTSEAVDIKPGVRNVVIDGNRIRDITTSNSGAIVAGLVYGAEGVEHFDANIVISNNRISDVTRTSPWSDGNAITINTPALIYNNVIWNIEHSGIKLESNFQNPDARTVRIFHNTIVGVGVAPVEIQAGANPPTLEVVNNIGPRSEGNLSADDSLFVDAAGADFSLAAGAAAIDAAAELALAASIPGLGLDLLGVPRPVGSAADLGALEAGG